MKWTTSSLRSEKKKVRKRKRKREKNPEAIILTQHLSHTLECDGDLLQHLVVRAVDEVQEHANTVLSLGVTTR
jgi:hypothetical protein